MASEKNKGGRPRRADGETLQRLSLSLRPAMRIGLDILSRQRKVSLSQACEFALAVALRDTQVANLSALEVAEQLARVDPHFRDHPELIFPEELLDPHERFARDIWHEVAARARVVMGSHYDQWEVVYTPGVLALGGVGFRDGMSMPQVVEMAIEAAGLRNGGIEATRFIDSLDDDSPE